MHEQVLIKQVVTGYGSDPLLTEEALLSEGLVSTDTVKDAIQYVLGASAEYGLGTVTLPAAGAGLAVGPAVETIVDSLFTAEEVASTVNAISNAKSMAGEYADLVKDAYNAYDPSNFKGFYKSLVAIVKRVLKTFKKATKSIDKVVKEIKEALQAMIAAIVRPIEQAIKFIIPEATIGTAAAKAIGAALSALAENAYSLITSAIKKVEMLQNFVSNPSSAMSFFEDVVGQVINLLNSAADAIEDAGALKSFAAIAAATVSTAGAGLIPALLTKGLGPKAFRAAASMLEKHKPKLIKLVDKILNVVIPYAMTCLALFQIFMKGDYKDKEGKNDMTKNNASNEALRRIVRHRLISEQSRGSQVVELTELPDQHAISDAWPERVTHNGKNVFDTFYGAPGGGGSSDAFDWLSREGYDGQEVYLGYDPQSDNFVMGFDAFYDEVDEYGNSDPGGMMEGVLILLDPRGRALETIASVPGGMYPAGIRAAKHAMPGIIDVRLD